MTRVQMVCGFAAISSLPWMGCNTNNNPPTHPVTGVVTLDGKPVEGAAVMFLTDDPKIQPAMATSDASGKYELATFVGGDGAMPGTFKVTATKIITEAGPSPYTAKPAEGISPNASLEDQYKAYEKGYEKAPKGPDGNPRRTPKSTNELPKKYENAASSGLSHTVVAGSNKFDIELKSK